MFTPTTNATPVTRSVETQQAQTQEGPFAALPPEITAHIFSFTPNPAALATVSHSYHDVSSICFNLSDLESFPDYIQTALAPLVPCSLQEASKIIYATLTTRMQLLFKAEYILQTSRTPAANVLSEVANGIEKHNFESYRAAIRYLDNPALQRETVSTLTRNIRTDFTASDLALFAPETQEFIKLFLIDMNQPLPAPRQMVTDCLHGMIELRRQSIGLPETHPSQYDLTALATADRELTVRGATFYHTIKQMALETLKEAYYNHFRTTPPTSFFTDFGFAWCELEEGNFRSYVEAVNHLQNPDLIHATVLSLPAYTPPALPAGPFCPYLPQ